MPIYCVDTLNGSDSNNGSSWAQAWKTCRPLKALYAGVEDVQDLEVRFAKSTPIRSDCTVRRVEPSYGDGSKSILTGGSHLVGRWSTTPKDGTGVGDRYRRIPIAAGGTYSWSEYRVLTEYGYGGVGMQESTKRLCSQPSDVSDIEILWHTVGSNSLTATLELYDVSSGTVGPAFATIPLPQPPARSHMCVQAVHNVLVSKPAEATHIGWKVTVVNTGAAVDLFCGQFGTLRSSYPVDSPYYCGHNTLFVPNSRFGMPFAACQVNSDADRDTDGSYFGTERITLYTPANNIVHDAMPERDITWSKYRWVDYSYDRTEALMPSALYVGSESVPLKISGGWDTDSNTRVGITALDAANLLWFYPTLAKISIDVRGLALIGGVLVASGDILFSNLMSTSPTLDLEIGNALADGVHIIHPASSEVHQYFEPTASGWSPGGMNTEQVDDYGPNVTGTKTCHLIGSRKKGTGSNTQQISNSTCAWGNFFGTVPVATSITDSAFVGSVEMYKHTSTYTYERCTFFNVQGTDDRFKSSMRGGYSIATLNDCDVVNANNDFSSDGIVGLVCASMYGCRLYGPRTGPTAVMYEAKNIEYTVCGTLATDIMCEARAYSYVESTQTWWPYYTRGEIAFDNLNISIAPGAVTPDYLFLCRKVSLHNSRLEDVYPTVYTPSAYYELTAPYEVLEVNLENVTLATSIPRTTPVFTSSRVVGHNVTLDGPWSSLLGKTVTDVDVRGLNITDAATKIFGDGYRLMGTTAAHTSSFVTDISSPAADLLDLIGEPLRLIQDGPGNANTGIDYAPKTPSGGAYVSAADGRTLWLNSFIAVQPQTSDSWKVTALMPCGSLQAARFPAGTIPVVAGALLKFRVKAKRTTRDALCGIFIRHNQTREWAGTGVVETNVFRDAECMQDHSLPVDTWEQLEVQYTPFRDGLVDLYVGCRAVSGSVVYFKDIEIVR